MQELVKLVANETGLSHEMATIAVRTTLDFVKTKLPALVASQIDTALKRSAPSSEVRTYLERFMPYHKTK